MKDLTPQEIQQLLDKQINDTKEFRKTADTTVNRVHGQSSRWSNDSSEDVRKKYSKSATEMNANRKEDPELMAKISEKISRGRKGISPTQETIEKMLNTKREKGILNSPSWNKGISPSASTREKISIANKGKTLSEETKSKIAQNCANNKEVSTPEGIFVSISAASKHYFENDIWPTRSSLASVRQLIREHVVDPNNKEFYFTKKG